MTDERGNWITYNGEVYNYIELRQELIAGTVLVHGEFVAEAERNEILLALDTPPADAPTPTNCSS